MWYEKDASKTLDFSKPIFAKNHDFTYLLTPVRDIKAGSNVVGYDWLNIKLGNFNSSQCWTDPVKAVESYVSYGYEIYNKDL